MGSKVRSSPKQYRLCGQDEHKAVIVPAGLIGATPAGASAFGCIYLDIQREFYYLVGPRIE